MKTDKVGHLLEQRADIEDLKQQHILETTNVAPALQSTQRTLQNKLARANLYHSLKHRPPRQVLQQQGVIKDSENENASSNIQFSNQNLGVSQTPSNSTSLNPNQNFKNNNGATSSSSSRNGPSSSGRSYQRRSKNFHLTRILLKSVASMAESGEVSLSQKGYLKDLIVDQDPTILEIAEHFDAENDLLEFKDNLLRLASSRKA